MFFSDSGAEERREERKGGRGAGGRGAGGGRGLMPGLISCTEMTGVHSSDQPCDHGNWE